MEKMPTTAVAVSDAGLPPLEPGASPTRIRGKAQEEELQPPVLETPPRPSLSGSHSVGLWGVQNLPSSGIRNQDLRLPKHRPAPGHSSNSRIVWEHTRGRYNCLQCPYSTASREEMTQHTEEHRKNPSPPGRLDGEMDFGVAIPSFHPKLTPPDVENPLFSPL
nr:PREDICTED: zinc finger protein 414 [Anolis carolinensis]|eukprot:XP_008123706.1 PREDICTED: zinc finger protein 414 [Anolis carolinensis]